MDLSFLTPLGALVALAGLVPVAILVLRERRARRIRSALGVAGPPRRTLATTAFAVATIPVLLALASMQPVLDLTRTRPERTDAELYVVLDTSRSMLASATEDDPTRYDRAVDTADRLMRSFGDVPIGLASITDRVLPHVLPTTDARVYLSALHRSVGIERPPPAFFYTEHATTLGALRVVPTRRFFSPAARKRVLVVLTDGETREAGPQFARAFNRAQRRIETFFVRFWAEEDRIWETGIPEAGYRPNPRTAAGVDRAAETIGARVVDEDDVDELVEAARSYLGEGPTRDREREGEKLALMPYLTALVLLPLGLVLRRRNL